MIRYRALPPECFAPLRVPELPDDARNEDLARAYRDARAAAALQDERLQRCRQLGAPL